MIPKIIHQTWKSDKIPPRFVPFVDSWKSHHPDYTYMLWTDDNNREFVKNEYPNFLYLYDTIPTPVMKCDFMRYLIIYHFGGYYVDLDVMCHKALENLPKLPSHDVVLTEEHPSHCVEFSIPKIVTNWFLGCAKGSAFMLDIITKVKMRLFNNPSVTEPLSITGPFMMTNAYDELKSKYAGTILLLDYAYLNPFPKTFIWLQNTLPPVPKKTIGVHYYVGHCGGSKHKNKQVTSKTRPR